MLATQSSAPGCCVGCAGTECLLCVRYGANALREVPLLASPPRQEAATLMIPMLEMQGLRGEAERLVHGCVRRAGPE